MKKFKNSKRYLAFALTFLMPIYVNFELLAEQNKEKIEVFENIKNEEGRAEALANTQKEFRNHPIKAWRHPNVWAAFQLSGDWRPIDF